MPRVFKAPSPSPPSRATWGNLRLQSFNLLLEFFGAILGILRAPLCGTQGLTVSLGRLIVWVFEWPTPISFAFSLPEMRHTIDVLHRSLEGRGKPGGEPTDGGLLGVAAKNSSRGKKKFCPQKIRGGRVGFESGRIPGTDCPLDPEPGLGGMFSLGLLQRKASSFLVYIPVS